MNQPRKPNDLPDDPAPAGKPSQTVPDGQKDAEPKGSPSSDRHETETAGS